MAGSDNIKRVRVKETNTSDRPLGDFLRDMMRDQILSHVQVAEKASEESGFAEYATKPHLFISEVLRETVTPDIRRLIKSVWENPVTFAESANGTGKTHGAARIAVAWYKIFPGAQVHTAAAPPEDNLKKLLWGEIGSIVEKNPGLFVNDKVSLSSLEIKRGALEYITGHAIPQSGKPEERKARFSGRHAPYLLFILDEGDAIPAEIYEAIESCMSGGILVRLLVLYNPRSKSGPVYQMAKSGQANVIRLSAFNHPNVLTGKEVIPGAVNREITCRRISAWTRPLLSGESIDATVFLVPDYLVGYQATKKDGKSKYPPIPPGYRKIEVPAFSYMVLGMASSMAEDQLIDRAWCEAARERWDRWVKAHGTTPAFSIRPRMGQDVAEFGADFSVATFRYGGFVAPQEVWAGVDITATSDRAYLLFNQYGAEEAFIDANGLGAGVWSNLVQKGILAYRIMVTESPTEEAMYGDESLGQFFQVRDQMWWTCREWLRTDPDAMLPPEADELGGLIDQLCAATYMRDMRNKIKICNNDVMKEKLNGKSPDHATSLVLTFAPIPDDGTGGEYHGSNYLN